MLPKLLLITLALYSFHLNAAESGQLDLSALQAILPPDKTPDSVTPTAVPGIYEVIVDARIMYVSEDGRFVLQGDVIDLEKKVNLTEIRRNGLRAQAIDDVGEENMLVFAPTEASKHTVTVFTDIDCGYCRKLHREMASYNEQGIKVRYLLYPRAGLGSPSYAKAVTAWCSDDRQDALTRAKLGEDIGNKTCDNPVNTHFELGQSIGVRGTPSIILENGQMVPGYIPASRLAQILKNSSGN